MQEVNETLSPGAVIRSRYLVIDLLGKGGFSTVYLVQDLQGSFCEIDQNGACIPNGMFGFWTVAPSPTR
jgi:hypothetical protein